MLDVTHIIQSGGLVLLALFLFSEVGLMLGFFLPGDTLLIAAGVYAAEGKMSLAAVIIVAAIAASAGDSTSYWIGHHLGRRLFRNPNSVIFRQDHIAKAEKFYERHGTKTVLVAHFLPVVRTFTPLLAGVGQMPYIKYVSLDVIGDTCWAVTVTLLGYYFGSRIPNIDHYLLIAVAAVVVCSLAPTLYQIVKLLMKRHRKNSAIASKATTKKVDQD